MMSYHKIKARDILADIRSRLSDEELMEKFEISKEGLQDAFDQLLQAGLITRQELRNRAGTSASSDETTRTLPRHYLVVRVEIYERGNQSNTGIIKDINEKGVGIVGVQAALDEVIDLIIPASDFTMVDEISFQAKCRWTKVSAEGKSVCGFQVVAIEDEDLNRLRELIHELSFEIPM